MGDYTTNNYFYKPDLGAGGQTEKNKFDNAVDTADAQIEQNKNGAQSLTVDDSSAPSTNSGTLKNILGWIANRLTAITGKSDWKTAPKRTLEATGTISEQDYNSVNITGGSITDIYVDKDIGGLAQYEGDGNSNPVVNHPNTPFVSGEIMPLGGLSGTLCPHENLTIANNSTNPDYQVDVDADYLILFNSDRSLAVRMSSVDLTIDITTAGANGLDTGSEASDTWYHIWVIYDGSTVAGMFSTASSYSGLTLPSGYNFAGYVGAIYNDANNDFISMQQTNTAVVFAPLSRDVANGIAEVWTSFAVAVPSTAKNWRGFLRLDFAAACNRVLKMSEKGSGLGETDYRLYSGAANQSVPAALPIVEMQTLYYTLDSNVDVDCDIYTIGWGY